MLESHPYYKGFYIVPAYAGHIKNIDEVKDIIDKVDAGKYDDKPKGTITITMGRFLEGTTVPKWWCVHQMNDDKSAADYFQGSFRTKSEDKNNDKRHVLVYDYNPERFIQVVYEINLDNNRRTAGQTTGALIREWREVSDVYDYSDNAWNVVTGDSIVEQANRSVEVKINAFNSVAVDHQKITVALQQIMNSVNLKKQWNATTNLNTQGINTTANQQSSSNGPSQASGIPLVPNQTSIAVDKFKQAMGKIYNAIWNTIDREPIGSFDDICNYPDESFIETTTGLTPAEWTLWKNSGAIMNIDQINRRIDAINESLVE
jgi:TATA-box binding protein (TBP) (component of TFIID and TFIIIB)